MYIFLAYALLSMVVVFECVYEVCVCVCVSTCYLFDDLCVLRLYLVPVYVCVLECLYGVGG